MAKRRSKAAEDQKREGAAALAALMADYRRYRLITVVLSACCMVLLAAAMGLYKTGTIDGETQLTLIMGSFIFVGAILFIVFARVRPLKADIRTIDAEGAPAPGKGSGAETGLERRTAADKYPPTPEYKRMRRIWRVLVMLAVAIMVGAMALVRINPADGTTPVVVLLFSYVFIFFAVYVEVKKLKPLRKRWQEGQAKAKKRGSGTQGGKR